MSSPYLTRDEAMEYLRVGNMTMWRLTNEGKIPYHQDRPGARMLFATSDLERYMQSIKSTAAVAAVTSLSGTYRKKRVKSA